MGRKRKVVQPVDGDCETFVSDAFSNADGLKDELESWYDNLPESFQNGEKGEALQEAISALEGANQPDVPDITSGLVARYTPSGKRKQSRADRLEECKSMLSAASQAAQDEVARLNDLKFDDDGDAIDADDELIAATDLGEDPATEEERDGRVGELTTFAEECDDAVSEWDNVNFPGMYG